MQNTIFVGLDIHKATISVAIAQGERGGEVRHGGTIPNRADPVRSLAEKLGRYDFRGARRSNATHASPNDPDARLYEKSPAPARCFMAMQ